VSNWPYMLYCGDETGSDWAGSDEIDMEFRVDGQQLPLLPYLSRNTIGGAATDMDSGDSVSLEHVLRPVRFVDNLQVILHEMDGNDIDETGSIMINALGPQQTVSHKQSPSISLGSGDYEFRYGLSRSFNYSAGE